MKSGAWGQHSWVCELQKVLSLSNKNEEIPEDIPIVAKNSVKFGRG